MIKIQTRIGITNLMTIYLWKKQKSFNKKMKIIVNKKILKTKNKIII